MADRNLVLQLLIRAKDEASAVFGKVFSALNDTTNVIAGKIRAAFTGLFGGALDGAMDFEAQLDRVIAKGDETYQSFAGLGGKIREVGAQFGISGTEAAQGMEALAAAGLSATDAIGALPSVLALAASEQISADAAAQKLIDSLSIMGLGFEETGRMADVLAKGANITTSSASQLAEALSQAGGMARAAGMNLESTVAALDLLHKNGIKGAEAGTALKTVLTALIDPSSKASGALTDLGIDSRDLGSVLGALQEKGTAANGAILAFGTEAGPGLRALLSEGQEGLRNYTAQLQDSSGAAAAASEQMGGNLRGAMASLASIWDTVKQSLLEPALKPLADAARDAATALQESLGTQAFKSVQDAIGAFVAQGIDAAKRFIGSFDFSAVGPAITRFAAEAKDQLSGLGTAAETTANVVKLAWNGVTLAIKSVAIVLAGFTATIATSMETVVVAMSKIGLASDDSAKAIARAAEQSRQAVVNLRDGIETDAGDIKDAWDGINGKLEETPGALEKIPPKVKEVKDALDEIKPPDLTNTVELQAFIEDLDYFKTKLQQAEDAQKSASLTAREAERVYLDVSNRVKEGTASQDSLELALQRAKAAQQAESVAAQETVLARARLNAEIFDSMRRIDEESTAVTNSIQTKEQLIAALKRTADQSKTYSDTLQEVADAQIAAKKAEIDLAEAKGDTAGAQRMAAELAQMELELSLKVAQAKAAEMQANLALAQALRDQVASKVANNEASVQELKLAELNVQRAEAQANAANLQVQSIEAVRDKTYQLSGAQQQAAQATGQQTSAIQQNTAATQDNADATEQSTASHGTLAGAIGSMIGFWQQQTAALSEATRALFEWNAGLSKIDPQYGMGAMEGVSEAADKAANEIKNLTMFVRELDKQITMSVNDIALHMDLTQKAGATAKIAYYEQLQAAEALAASLRNMGAENEVALEGLIDRAEVGRDAFYLLNEQDLSKLQGEIDRARQKLEQMNQATQNAKDRLAELNAELLEAQGADQKAEMLRQQLSFQQQLAEIEKQRAEAEAAGNRELLAILAEQEATLRKINDTKIRNIEADTASETAGDRLARTWRGAADAVDATGVALARLSGTDLTRLHTQVTGIAEQAGKLRDAL